MSNGVETTCVIIKPDAVKKGLIGEILKRFEQRDLIIVGLEMFQNSRSAVEEQYPVTDAVLERLGGKTAASYAEAGWDMMTDFGTTDLVEMGKMVREWLIEYLTSAPMVKVAVKGPHAISVVRKIIGDTMPYRADMGTIRGDFSNDSPALANREKRVMRNIVHASQDIGEAENEIKLYFGELFEH
jgi:nucleoside-diphosphate kinase